MTIIVSSAKGSEIVGESWEDLHTHLHNTASRGYTDKVMAWFDSGHAEDFKIMNGEVEETWSVSSL